jgi:hypothetical protein
VTASARRYQLPDGRWIQVSSASAPPESTHLGPLWEISVEGGGDEETGVGHPLSSSLADVLGYRVGFEDWPGWIDELAQRIERDFGEPHSEGD